MSRDLATMQHHLNLVREHARELKIEKRNLLVEQFEVEQRLIKTKRRYRVTVVVLSVATVWFGYLNMQYGAENRWFANELKQSKDLQYRFDNNLEALHYRDSRVLELEHANEQLIKHCRPCDVQRAIKATPLPDLVRT